MTKIAFRVDSTQDPRKFQRCLALAQGIKETDPESEIFFLSACTADEAAVISAAGMTCIAMENFGAWDSDATAEQVEQKSINILILDNEDVDETYLEILHKKTFLAIFDERAHLKKYDSDVIINPSINAHLLQYSDSEAELLLGTDFMALPPGLDQFQEQGVKRVNPPRARKILLCFGKDPKGSSVRAVRSLKGLKDNFSATVITDPAFNKGEQLATEIGLDSRFIIISERNSSKRFQGADLGIADPSFLPEVLFFTLPTVFVCADPSPEAEYAARNGIAAGVFDYSVLGMTVSGLLSDLSSRDRMSIRMADLVDGLGRFRLADELLRLYREKEQSL